MTKPILSLAPLQGFTDYPYRIALHKIIGGIDKYYTPYLRLEKDKTLKKKHLKDILPEHNNYPCIPQILVNNSSDFIHLAKLIADSGYTELNLNLGCPYPMVTNRDLGAGLLVKPDIILKMLDEALPKINIDVSIKMRLGMYNAKNAYYLLPKFDKYPLSEIIIHPRIAKQLYRGSVNLDAFLECLSLSKHKLAYNGDIASLEQFEIIQNQFAGINHFMIGRGLLKNPFLAHEIKNGRITSFAEKLDKLSCFHNSIYEYIKQATSGKTHLLNKVFNFWTYFSENFPESKKTFKAIKKCKSENDYQSIVSDLFNQ